MSVRRHRSTLGDLLKCSRTGQDSLTVRFNLQYTGGAITEMRPLFTIRQYGTNKTVDATFTQVCVIGYAGFKTGAVDTVNQMSSQ